ncbi:MAG: SDR family oxidoreductase, partial [Planctomycetes bacterium]|nr:SDR family oxidoreductase [Planctomycetota bacterium]
MEPLFAGRRGLITGVFNKQSIAWAIAEQILNEGGVCGFSYMPDKPDDERKKNLNRLAKLTEGNPNVAFLQPMDVTKDEDVAELMNVCRKKLGKLDFLLHSIAFAPPEDLKRATIETSRAGFKLGMEISAYSLIAIAA